jgi:hypothetical protein
VVPHVFPRLESKLGRALHNFKPNTINQVVDKKTISPDPKILSKLARIIFVMLNCSARQALPGCLKSPKRRTVEHLPSGPISGTEHRSICGDTDCLEMKEAPSLDLIR